MCSFCFIFTKKYEIIIFVKSNKYSVACEFQNQLLGDLMYVLRILCSLVFTTQFVSGLSADSTNCRDQNAARDARAARRAAAQEIGRQAPIVLVGSMATPVVESTPAVIEAPALGDCTICTRSLDDAQEAVTVFSCTHTFHADCITTWGKINPSCPLCRKAFTNDERHELGIQPMVPVTADIIVERPAFNDADEQLATALFSGNRESFHAALTAGANINATTLFLFGDTPLHAVIRNHQQASQRTVRHLVRDLIAAGASVNEVNSAGVPLSIWLSGGLPDVGGLLPLI